MPETDRVHLTLRCETRVGVPETHPPGLLDQYITEAILTDRSLTLHFKSGGYAVVRIPNDDVKLEVETHAA